MADQLSNGPPGPAAPAPGGDAAGQSVGSQVEDEVSVPEEGYLYAVEAVSLAPWAEADDHTSYDIGSDLESDADVPEEGEPQQPGDDDRAVGRWHTGASSSSPPQDQGRGDAPENVAKLPTTVSRRTLSRGTPTHSDSSPPSKSIGKTLSNALLTSSLGGLTSTSKRSSLTMSSLAQRSPATHALIDQKVSIRGTQLLRGAEQCKVMHGLGYLFDSSDGSDRTYALSEPAQHDLADFISHNWSTGRFLKFFTLALHYNCTTAVRASLFTAVVLGTLTAAGFLPARASHPDYPWSGIICLGSVAVFIVAVCFGHEIRFCLLRFGFTNKRNLVFLDKVCIHQTDADAQKEGIQNLAGFLRESRHIVVVYSSVYLRRLWTVYELASFLMLRREEAGITLLPVSWTTNCITVFLVCLVAQLVTYSFFVVGEASYGFIEKDGEGGEVSRPAPVIANFLASLVLFTLVAYMTHRWRRHRKSVEQTIQNFNVRGASCKEEADRALVTENICNFMRCIEQVPPTATDDEALDEFDQVVQAELPHVLAATVGEQVFPFQRTLLGTLPWLFGALDTIAAGVQLGDPPAHQLARSVFHITRAVCYVPFSFYCITWLFARANPTGWKVLLVSLIAPWPGILLFTPPNWILVLLHERWSGARLDWGLLGSLIVYCIFVAGWTIKLYRKDPLIRYFLALLRCKTAGEDLEPWAEAVVPPPPSLPCDVVQDI